MPGQLACELLGTLLGLSPFHCRAPWLQTPELMWAQEIWSQIPTELVSPHRFRLVWNSFYSPHWSCTNDADSSATSQVLELQAMPPHLGQKTWPSYCSVWRRLSGRRVKEHSEQRGWGASGEIRQAHSFPQSPLGSEYSAWTIYLGSN